MKRVVAWDTETALFRPGVMAPEIVCAQWQEKVVGWEVKDEPRVVTHTDFLSVLEDWLRDPDVILVGQNVQYDVAVTCAEWPHLLPIWFDKYDANLVTDTKWRQILLDTACGCYRWRTDSSGKRVRVGYSLADLALRHLGRNLWKEGGPRTDYGRLRGVPVSEWPAEHVKYALDDGINTLDVYLAQEDLRRALISEYGWDPLASEFREARAYLALHLASVWGLRTDGAKVDELERDTIRAIEMVQDRLVEAGLVRKDGSRDTKKAAAYMTSVCEAKGLPIPRTPKGGVCLDADACELADDDLLNDYAEYVTLNTLLAKDVKLLRAGTRFPVHTNFGFAESDRVTSSGPNVQNFARAA